ncbi:MULTISPECIES: NAD(P)/FAD-dependent oxidoreductase [Psychrilyobacter]|uniref:FAD-dependent oxidoreductase n=1 Tax=Psychrilyobacter piezotolerans TaxID=2293438 RepID=A0ABX9KFN0_9FUSO|nr:MULTISPECIES: NAD(P)/FAD-dependent oxidoreductase [Psychrilyobacter]MCS5421397.1 FAD-dependent oxidoreductase [Psychrilyobacter sp. S5]NDI78484.1 NAD(P)/FAD-dependent oxidoreductase [Psychrilyobacter piezotolerans]RDE60669.1 FAD/NAD(P)-binding oxidoreductase [Psychrilyobacter sp. S5]REI40596.1 FAD-dependent oxidoreductase [Psychrilyobacter piezotolerans]
MYDIAIIGGGVIGCGIARELSKYKIETVVIEQEGDVSCGATKANSGIIHGGYDAAYGTKKGYFSHRGNILFDKLEKELNFGFERIGSLVLAFDNEEMKTLSEIMENGKKNGVGDLKIIGKEELLQLEPNVGEAIGALYCKGAGIVSPYEYCIALAENAISNGVEFKFNRRVNDINKEKDIYTIKTALEEVRSKVVINAAGVNSDTVSCMVNEEYFHIIPRKGEYLVYTKGYGDKVNHVIFQCPNEKGKGVLVTPTYHNNLMVGPDAQIMDDKYDTSTNIDNLFNIIEKAERSIPNLENKKIIRSFAGTRATSSLHDFIIEKTKSKNFINVAGIDSPGITSSPAIARYVRGLVEKMIDLPENDEFNPYREPNIIKKSKDDMLPMKIVNEYINLGEDDPDRIVCRCEQVRLREIMDALDRGIKITSTDGIKRRTRAGMGICQGSFCEPRVKKIIAKRYGISEDEITTRGIGSGSEPVRVEIMKFKKQCEAASKKNF